MLRAPRISLARTRARTGASAKSPAPFGGISCRCIATHLIARSHDRNRIIITHPAPPPAAASINLLINSTQLGKPPRGGQRVDSVSALLQHRQDAPCLFQHPAAVRMVNRLFRAVLNPLDHLPKVIWKMCSWHKHLRQAAVAGFAKLVLIECRSARCELDGRVII